MSFGKNNKITDLLARRYCCESSRNLHETNHPLDERIRKPFKLARKSRDKSHNLVTPSSILAKLAEVLSTQPSGILIRSSQNLAGFDQSLMSSRQNLVTFQNSYSLFKFNKEAMGRSRRQDKKVPGLLNLVKTQVKPSPV